MDSVTVGFTHPSGAAAEATLALDAVLLSPTLRCFTSKAGERRWTPGTQSSNPDSPDTAICEPETLSPVSLFPVHVSGRKFRERNETTLYSELGIVDSQATQASPE